MTEFFISSLQMNALKVNKNKSLALRVKNLSYNLFTQCVCDRWNSFVLDVIEDTFECGILIESED